MITNWWSINFGFFALVFFSQILLSTIRMGIVSIAIIFDSSQFCSCHCLSRDHEGGGVKGLCRGGAGGGSRRVAALSPGKPANLQAASGEGGPPSACCEAEGGIIAGPGSEPGLPPRLMSESLSEGGGELPPPLRPPCCCSLKKTETKFIRYVYSIYIFVYLI